jgi:hypothetical protein
LISTMAACTSRTSSRSTPLSQEMRRSASSSASPWTWVTIRSSSASDNGSFGSARRTVLEEVVPFTSSPAIPITATRGFRPA